MRKPIVILSALALVGVIAWVGSRPAPVAFLEPVRTADSEATTSTHAPANLVDVPGHEHAVGAVAPGEAATPISARSEAADPWNGGRATLEIHVLAREDRRPIGAARVEVLAYAPGDRGPGRSLPFPVAEGAVGADGRVRFPVDAGRELLVVAWGLGGGAGQGVLDVEVLAAGEERAVEVLLATRCDRRVSGVLLREEDGLPVAGASVYAFGRLGAGTEDPSEPSDFDADPIEPIAYAESDELGRFEIDAPTWRRTDHLQIAAEGRADEFRRFPSLPGGNGPRHRFERRAGGRDGAGPPTVFEIEPIHLLRCALLRVRVLGRDGQPVARASVRALLDPSLVPDGPRGLFGAPLAWEATTDADGRCEIDCAPVRLPLVLELVHEGKLVRPDAAPLELEPGEARELVRTLAAGTTIRGVLLDELHQPLRARVQLALVATAEPSLRIAGATTGPEGRFTFEDVPPGTWRIESVSGSTGDARRVVPEEVTIAEGTPVIEVRVGYRR